MSRKFKQVVVPFSGTFSFEAVCTQAGYQPSQLVGNDPSLYSYAIGRYLNGQLPQVEIVNEQVRFISEITDPEEAAASLIWCIRLAQLSKGKDAYTRGLQDSLSSQKAETIAGLKIKLRRLKEKLQGLKAYCTDGWEIIEKYKDSECLMLLDPPFYKLGFDKQFSVTKDFFKWPGSDITHFDVESGYNRMTTLLRDSPCTPIFTFTGHENPTTFWSGYEVIGASNKNLKRRVCTEYLLGRAADKWKPTILTEKKLLELPKGIPSLYAKDSMPKKLEVKIVSSKFWLGYHLCRNWEPGKPDFEAALLADGELLATYGWVTKDVNRFKTTYAGLIYCFSSPLCRMNHLQKLCLRIALSKEMETVIRFKSLKAAKIEGVQTSVFSRHPETKAQRGVFKLFLREKKPEGYRLVYRNEFQGTPIQEVVRQWK